ncbi:MAG: hypothetical protein ACYC8W_11750 [Candidatus Tyrphobacter sp.]
MRRLGRRRLSAAGMAVTAAGMVCAVCFFVLWYLNAVQPSWWVPIGALLASGGEAAMLHAFDHGVPVIVLEIPLAAPGVVLTVLLARAMQKPLATFVQRKPIAIDYGIIFILLAAALEPIASHYVGVLFGGERLSFAANELLPSSTYPEVGSADIGIMFACCAAFVRLRVAPPTLSCFLQILCLIDASYAYWYYAWLGASALDLIGSMLFSGAAIGFGVLVFGFARLGSRPNA